MIVRRSTGLGRNDVTASPTHYIQARKEILSKPYRPGFEMLPLLLTPLLILKRLPLGND